MLLPLATTPTVPQPRFSRLCTPVENLQLQSPSSGASPCLSAPQTPGRAGPPEPTLNCWLPAFTRTMVPGPRLLSLDSSPNISRRNLFWEEWTRARTSLFSTSRFFSRKPVGKQSPIPRQLRPGRGGGGAGRRPPCPPPPPHGLASVPALSTKSCHTYSLQPPQPSIPTPNSLIRACTHPRGSPLSPGTCAPPQGPPLS